MAVDRSTRTDAHGVYRWSCDSLGAGEVKLRAVAPRTRSYATASSPQRIVQIYRTPRVTIARSPSTASVGSALTFTGTVGPFVSGQPVSLQRATSGTAWSVVASTTVTKAGAYAVADTAAAGTWKYRVVVPRVRSAWLAEATSPVLTVTPGIGWASVSAGNSHSCAIKADKTLWCFGDDSFGEVGDGTSSTAAVVRPSRVGADSDWSSVAAGDRFSCAIKTTGTLWCWGRNFASTGMGAPPATSPVQVGTQAWWTKVSTGANHACALNTAGGIFCWGLNFNGQLGLGDDSGFPAPVTTPTQIKSTKVWVSVGPGSFHTCATASDGTLACWGAGTYGQLATGDTAKHTLPVDVAGLAKWSKVTAGENHTCATRDDSTVWCWGQNSSGQLGSGDTNDSLKPVPVTGRAADTLAAGTWSSCALAADHTLWCWGLNADGQLGVGDSANRTSPVQVTSSVGWSSVAAGGSHTCAIRTDGSLWCWGANARGELGVGDSTDRWAPVRVG